MAKKKRKPRNRPGNPQTASRPSPPAGGERWQTASARRPGTRRRGPAVARARRPRGRPARPRGKRQTRVSFARRFIVIGVISLVTVTILYFLEKGASPRPISAEAIAAAQQAKCSGVTKPSGNPTGGHLNPGQSYTYAQHPATSGLHDPSPLGVSPDIYTEPVPETQAVHFLEHAGVIIYYRAATVSTPGSTASPTPDPNALPQAVIDALGKVADEQPNTLLAPYPDLPEGTSLALTAWNRLQTCPATVTAAQASTIANGFAHAFVCTSVAPEPKNSPDC